MGRPVELNFHHGTTTLGFLYQGGIVLAVDSRATGGQYIGSQCMKKIVEINDFMLGTLAGGAADCVYWDRVLSKQCRLHELRNKERISVTAASKIMSNMIYYYKGYGLSIGMMLAGYDKNVRTWFIELYFNYLNNSDKFFKIYCRAHLYFTSTMMALELQVKFSQLVLVHCMHLVYLIRVINGILLTKKPKHWVKELYSMLLIEMLTVVVLYEVN